ncbi:hypothetical protein, partial [Streptomyces sp. MH60]|uniref:hypothetical protein n=1 Tax=Streptomyces sp. MH60 TaxID=1940758 RepID=UPI0010573F25
MTNTSPYRPLGDSPGYGNPIDPADIPPPFETPTGARYTPAAADRADYAPRTADDVTTELVNMTVSIVDGWYADTRIDW